MGSRADFYVGRGEKAEWIGSIAWDGYPDGIPDDVKDAKTEAEFRLAVRTALAKRDDATFPEKGWPWPWEDSRTTDFAYAFDGGTVYASCFGREWFVAAGPEPENDGPKVAVFPNMKAIQKVTFGGRSGLMVFKGKAK